MADMKAAEQMWNKLLCEWEIVFSQARSGQQQISQKMQDCYHGKGPNPTMEELDKTQSLWAAERKLREAMDEIIKATFG